MKPQWLKTWEEIRMKSGAREFGVDGQPREQPTRRPSKIARFFRNLLGLFLDGQWGLGDHE
jgi:hypothetical protein